MAKSKLNLVFVNFFTMMKIVHLVPSAESGRIFRAKR